MKREPEQIGTRNDQGNYENVTGVTAVTASIDGDSNNVYTPTHFFLPFFGTNSLSGCASGDTVTVLHMTGKRVTAVTGEKLRFQPPDTGAMPTHAHLHCQMVLAASRRQPAIFFELAANRGDLELERLHSAHLPVRDLRQQIDVLFILIADSGDTRPGFLGLARVGKRQFAAEDGFVHLSIAEFSL